MCTTLKKPKHLSKSTGKGDDNKVNIFSMIKFYESIPGECTFPPYVNFNFIYVIFNYRLWNNSSSILLRISRTIECIEDSTYEFCKQMWFTE